MTVTQIYELVNDITTELTGEEAIINEDLSNVVDVGVAIQNLTGWQNKFVTALVDRIGKTVFVDRPYSGSAPSVLMDSWEYGSILMKISSDMPDATINQSWELTDGESYDPFVYHSNPAEAKFFDGMVTFEIEKTIIDRQLKSSFQNSSQLNSFISMIFNEVDKSLTLKNDALIMRTINSMIGDTFYDLDAAGTYSGKTGMKCVNLLYMYNQAMGQSLTPAAAMYDADFLRYASYQMGLYPARLSRMSRLFNVGGKARFTPASALHTVMLSEFKEAAGVYLYDAANQFNKDNLSFPAAETVPFWQGSGTNYAFSNTSAINIKTGSGNTVNCTGVLAIMFDRDALGVCNQDSRVTTAYNAKGEYTNYFYKRDARFFNDLNENFVVFYVA